MMDDDEALVGETSVELQSLVEQILNLLGEDPSREGLLKTPERVAKSLRFLTKGYEQNADEILNGALFTVKYDEMVVVRDIDFFSLWRAFLVLLLSLGSLAGDKPAVPTLRWTAETANCTFREGEDGRSYYGLSSGDFELTLAVDRQELEKIPHRAAVPMLGVFLNQQKTREEFLNLIRRGSREGV